MNIHVLELLASKICHDLISPIGAVNNGIEFLEDMGADALEDATDLISMSASQASAKLKAYRLAYGAGGADATHTPSEVYEIIQDVLGDKSRIAQVWRAGDLILPRDDAGAYPRGLCKILTGILLLGMACLPKGGTLDVKSDNDGVHVIAKGPDGGLRAGMAQALDLNGAQENLTPKIIHAHVCALMADCYGYGLEIATETQDQVVFTLSLPV